MRAKLVTPARLRRWPLPAPGPEGGKEDRGRVVIIGGSRELSGAPVLAAVAALRAGAGKLQLVVGREIQAQVAAELPEALVAALPERADGSLRIAAGSRPTELVRLAQAVLVGPGLVAHPDLRAFLATAPHGSATWILDAGALEVLRGPRRLRFGGRAILTPHAGEMAMLLGLAKSAVESDAPGIARRCAAESETITILKGAETYVATPDGTLYVNRRGNPGLGTCGSGDTLAGMIAGLAARGATPLQAAVWGVHLHAWAGERLARRIGPLGFLARELPGEVPALLRQFSART